MQTVLRLVGHLPNTLKKKLQRFARDCKGEKGRIAQVRAEVGADLLREETETEVEADLLGERTDEGAEAEIKTDQEEAEAEAEAGAHDHQERNTAEAEVGAGAGAERGETKVHQGLQEVECEIAVR